MYPFRTLALFLPLALWACEPAEEEFTQPPPSAQTDPDATKSNATNARSSVLVFQDNFETGCWRAFDHKRAEGGSCEAGVLWYNSQMQSNAAGRVVQEVGEPAVALPPRSGNHAMKFTWFRDGYRPDDSNNTSKAHLWSRFEFKTNTTRWYSFSMFLPSGSGGMDPDTEPEILVQWHGRPNFENGEPFRIPVAAISHLGSRLVFIYHYDPAEMSTVSSPQRGGSIELGQATQDQWIDFLIRVRWDPQGDGYLEINRKDQVEGASWQRLFKQTNGVKIGYNDISDPNVGIGIYKHDAGKRHRNGEPLSDYYRRQVFFDEFRIGNEQSVPADVQPR